MKGGILMSDIFKLILEGAKRTRPQKATDEKLNSILNNQESQNYFKEKNKKSDELFTKLENISIGEERDTTDHLAEINKLSMKELDKRNPKEQLKTLKLEYNRVYDKLTTLNKKTVDQERIISDLQMEQRISQEEVHQMKKLLRAIVYCFPGNPELKETLDQGAWKISDVEPNILSLMKRIVERMKNSEEIIAKEKETSQKEILKLKEMILKYKESFTKAEEMMKEQHTTIQSLKSQITRNEQKNYQSTEQQVAQPVSEQPKTVEKTPEPPKEKVVETPKVDKPSPKPVSKQPKEPNEQHTVKKENDVSGKSPTPEQNVATHTPHFSDFFNEFKSAVAKEKAAKQDSATNKQKNNNPIPKEISEDPFEANNPEAISDPFETNNSEPISDPFENETASENFDFNFDPFSSITPPSETTTQEKDHPLSPDFVEPEREEVEDVFDTTIDAYLQNISLQQEYLLKLIGNTGISRNSDLKEYLKDDEQGQKFYFIGKKYNANALNKDISDLRDKGLLSSEQINYGGKGSGFIVYELSKIGKACFKSLTDENPVVAEKKKIVGTHASLEHGYLIKDSAKLFIEMGYKVYTDLDDVSFKIDERHRKVFDFIAENEEGKLLHIEVERGTHTQEDFSRAMDKIYEITKEFYFICPNESVKNKNTKKKFFTWVTKSLGGIQKADVILNMVTIEQLKKKSKNIWETTDLRNVK